MIISHNVICFCVLSCLFTIFFKFPVPDQHEFCLRDLERCVSEGLEEIPCPVCCHQIDLSVIVPDLTLADLHHLHIQQQDLVFDRYDWLFIALMCCRSTF